MVYQSKVNILQLFLIGLMLVPFSVSALVFNPDSDVDFNLTEGSIFNYQSFLINEGVSVNYFLPENSFVNIVVENDIFIAGKINVSKNSSLTLISKQGDLTIIGSVKAGEARLEGTEGKINYAEATFTSDNELVPLSGELLLQFGPAILVKTNPLPTYYWSSGSSSTTGEVPLIPAVVPLPTPVLLFSSALFLLAGFRITGVKE